MEMRPVVFSFLLILFVHSTHSVVLKTRMTNSYPQIAVLGCDSRKANLYFDYERQVWVEDLSSQCIDNEQNLLEFCKKVYPSLQIGNIARLEQQLRFENWCELNPSTSDSSQPCQLYRPAEELIAQPIRCLHENSPQEDFLFPSSGCSRQRLQPRDRCERVERWEQFASIECSDRSMIFNSSLIPLEWCGLAKFRGVEFLCCSSKDTEGDVSTENSEQLKEDDPIEENNRLQTSSTSGSPQKLSTSSPSTTEPNWIQDYNNWSKDNGYFADDEDMNDEREEIKLSSARRSHLTISEHRRFSKAKEAFRQKYQQQIEQLKFRWQQRQAEVQLLANANAADAQSEYEKVDLEFHRLYDVLKQIASQERRRINEMHEKNLDRALETGKNEMKQRLKMAWNDRPLKTDLLQETIYNYLHVLLRDRIHLVNRYERLRAVDPPQAQRKRAFIHQRLQSIEQQINETLTQLRSSSEIQSKILPYLETLIAEYDEVNQAARRLLIDYNASLKSITNAKSSRPLSTAAKMNEYDDDTDDETSDEYDDDDMIPTDPNKNIKINGENRSNLDDRRSRLHPSSRLVSFIAVSLLICLILVMILVRLTMKCRQRSSHLKTNSRCHGVEYQTPDEKALQAFLGNGYENPTYRFFEQQPMKC